MRFAKSFLYLLTILVTLHAVSAKLTSEQKEKLKEGMREADKFIRFDDVKSLDSVTKHKGLTLLFFGATWCQYTQKFSPKWLEVQKVVDEQEFPSFHMGKVDCTVKHGDEDICAKKYGVYDFPTMLLWVDGVASGEYEDDDEATPLLRWIEKKVNWYKSRHAAAATTTHALPAPAVKHVAPTHNAAAAPPSAHKDGAPVPAAPPAHKKVEHTTTHHAASTHAAAPVHAAPAHAPAPAPAAHTTTVVHEAPKPTVPTPNNFKAVEASSVDVEAEIAPDHEEAKKSGSITGGVVAGVVVLAVVGAAVWKVRANKRRGTAIGATVYGAGTNREQLL
ncbi:hypothetical protein HK097_009706 [Rhizophlyctis rosea]|uniref:Thioredoxin domain-containing protein n=1 Tax=Rhizophlyctis rosea TaxID=64517 RepID=A0AAD5SBC0_9FUNG|nr:hypothetical protein HK097_009706 [Rhizophlyctis rosea]